MLPIFLVNNTFLYQGTIDNCCMLGYHGATSSYNGNGSQQVNTYMFASYSVQGVFAPNDGDTESFIADIHGLSHEVQEWYDDPFINNLVNPWLTPTAPQYGCTNVLETGDPVVGYGFKITMSNGITYHPEDEVHFSWFAREDAVSGGAGVLHLPQQLRRRGARLLAGRALLRHPSRPGRPGRPGWPPSIHRRGRSQPNAAKSRTARSCRWPVPSQLMREVHAGSRHPAVVSGMRRAPREGHRR